MGTDCTATRGESEKDRDRFMEALRKEIEPLIAQQSHHETTPRQRMLRDKVLRDTYEAVVVTGVLSDDEFWRQRYGAKLQEDTHSQKRGVPSAKTDIKELTSDQHHIRFSVSKADEEQYFQQHPLLRQKYDAEVPSVMSKQQFWTAFLEFSIIDQQHADLKARQRTHANSRPHTNMKLSEHYHSFQSFAEQDNDEAYRRFEEACSRNADTSLTITHDALDIYHGIYENRLPS